MLLIATDIGWAHNFSVNGLEYRPSWINRSRQLKLTLWRLSLFRRVRCKLFAKCTKYSSIIGIKRAALPSFFGYTKRSLKRISCQHGSNLFSHLYAALEHVKIKQLELVDQIPAPNLLNLSRSLVYPKDRNRYLIQKENQREENPSNQRVSNVMSWKCSVISWHQ